jgi:hypothetical protein
MPKVQGKKKTAARLKRAARAVKKRVVRKPAPPARAVKKVVAKVAASKPVKAVKRVAAALPAKAAVPPPATRPAAAPRPPAAPKKTRVRRARPRVQSNGAPVAAWLPPGGEKPRPSSFIPAPPRAEAPSLIAAPPASSDRLIRPEDVTEFVTRTVPIRVDVEQGGGRVFISVNPEEVTLRAGEGIEWDFRYIGGADVTVDEIVVEFDKPSPFSHQSFRSRKPGTARPHRQLSGAAQKSAVGKRIQYTIRAMTQFRTELAATQLFLNVQ